MKAIGLGVIVLALFAVVVLALWSHEQADAKRLKRFPAPSDADTIGIITDSGNVYANVGHHADHGSDGGGGHDGAAGDAGGHGGH